MFQIGEMIIYGKHGVCRVAAVGTLDMPMIDKNKQYYTLEPCKEKTATVYAPAENSKTVIRPILTREEAQKLIEEIPSLETVWVSNERDREQCYKEALKTCRCEDLIRIIKTLYVRQQSRIESGKKATAVDERYFRMAEEQLYGELCYVFGESREELEARIRWE